MPLLQSGYIVNHSWFAQKSENCCFCFLMWLGSSWCHLPTTCVIGGGDLLNPYDQESWLGTPCTLIFVPFCSQCKGTYGAKKSPNDPLIFNASVFQAISKLAKTFQYSLDLACGSLGCNVESWGSKEKFWPKLFLLEWKSMMWKSALAIWDSEMDTSSDREETGGKPPRIDLISGTGDWWSIIRFSQMLQVVN